MIGYLQGTCLEVSLGKILIGIEHQPSHRIGYIVHVPQAMTYQSISIQSSCQLWIHTHNKQDGADLYGFLTRAEKNLFITLLDATGVGPKSALNALSSSSVETIIQAILTDNQFVLAKVPGIGKKTAQRLVVDLRDSVAQKKDMGWFSAEPSIEVSKHTLFAQPAFVPEPSFYEEAFLALKQLGFQDASIQKALKKELKDLENCSLSDVIRRCLKHLGGNPVKTI